MTAQLTRNTKPKAPEQSLLGNLKQIGSAFSLEFYSNSIIAIVTLLLVYAASLQAPSTYFLTCL